MSRSSTLILVGLLILITSFTGLPLSWLHVLLPLFGLTIVIVGFLMRTDRIALMRHEMPPPVIAPSAHEVSPIA